MKGRKFIAVIAVLVGMVLVIYSCQKKARVTSSEAHKIKLYQAKEFPNLKNLQGFSQEALTLHLALYKGYVKKTNELIQKMQEMVKEGKANSPEFAELKRRFGFEFDGMKLHELYFESMGGGATLNHNSKLYKAIVANFGSFDAWKKDFIATAMIRGSGWVILYYDPSTGRLMNAWINEHHEGHLVNCKIIFPMDVFEHAYMIDFRLNKKEYVETFLKNLNWDIAIARFEGTSIQKKHKEKTSQEKGVTSKSEKTQQKNKVEKEKTLSKE